jgi:anaerobic magnesium-protoporphyrin IX monomethyl ester cyclase
MRALLISGNGPSIKNDRYLDGSLLDADSTRLDAWRERVWPGLRLERLTVGDSPLLQPRRHKVPHLTTFVLRAILDRCDVGYDYIDPHAIWEDEPYIAEDRYDVVLLSTTYIWEWRSLRRAVLWISQRWPDAVLVLGGQYSNLKYHRIMRECPEVDYIVRGDAERALPALLGALHHGTDVTAVPNLVARTGNGTIAKSELTYIEIDGEPSPSLDGAWPIVPYESMRGCPFRCGFCSFPHASPKWRFKSADKIARDWAHYARDCGARVVKAMDSTFTIPPHRMHKLMDLLPSLGIGWEAYSRANAIVDADYVHRLEDANCRSLSIGFESMSDATLTRMDKLVTAAQNHRAFELLQAGDVGYRCSFMVGYPGETPEDWVRTHDFLVNEFTGYYIMSVFSLQDETMPVWTRAAEFGLTVSDPDDYDYLWRHNGMDEPTARSLLNACLDEMRLGNDDAVLMHWQAMYEHPFLPSRPRSENMRLEKTIERLAMTPKDHPEPGDARAAIARHLDTLDRLGVRLPASGAAR